MEGKRATSASGQSARATSQQVRRFLLLGAVCFVIDFAVYHFLSGSCGFPITTAKELSYGCTIALAFWANKYWTFNSRGNMIRESILAIVVYFATFVANAGLNGALFAASLNFLDQVRARHAAFLLATVATTVLNFVGMKFVAFVPTGDGAPSTLQTVPGNSTDAEGDRSASSCRSTD